jgi:hypothetical protein
MIVLFTVLGAKKGNIPFQQISKILTNCYPLMFAKTVSKSLLLPLQVAFKGVYLFLPLPKIIQHV